MIKVVNPSVELWKQEGYTLDAIWKHIVRCTRVAYQSTPNNENEDAYEFLKRTIFKGKDVLNERLTKEDILSMHLSCCEHATVHLKIPMVDICLGCASRFIDQPYSRVKKYDRYCYVVTNVRVLLENNWMDSLKYIDNTPNNPYYIPRHTICFITDIGASRELNRHRVNSIVEESTRYCAYDKGKFGNGITVAKLPWIPHVDNEIDFSDYTNGFFNDNEIFNNECIEEHYTDNWTAIDWFFYGIQICDLVYRKTRELGWTAQQAREILPLNTKTQVVHTAFVDDWEHYIDLRSNGVSGAPHPMAKELADKVDDLINPTTCG